MRIPAFLLLLPVLILVGRGNAESTPSTIQETTMPVDTRAVAQPEGPIQDNSFLVEEAYNKEDGVIQHISFVQFLNTHDIVYTQTDEWPLRTIKHQLSVTMSFDQSGNYRESGPGWGDTAINYRYQLVGSGETRLAIAPRLSMLLPTGNSGAGRGYGARACRRICLSASS